MRKSIEQYFEFQSIFDSDDEYKCVNVVIDRTLSIFKKDFQVLTLCPSGIRVSLRFIKSESDYILKVPSNFQGHYYAILNQDVILIRKVLPSIEIFIAPNRAKIASLIFRKFRNDQLFDEIMFLKNKTEMYIMYAPIWTSELYKAQKAAISAYLKCKD